MTVYSCNTDCLYIERDLEKLKLFKRFNPEYFDLNKCMRCPKGHVDFNNFLLKDIQNKYLSGFHAEKLPEALFQVSGNYLLIILNGKDILQTKLLKISY
jgi:hypothetical protein